MPICIMYATRARILYEAPKVTYLYFNLLLDIGSATVSCRVTHIQPLVNAGVLPRLQDGGRALSYKIQGVFKLRAS